MGMSKAECGRLGGRATVARHGTEHMRAIGKAGFRGLVRYLSKRYQGASRREAVARLVAAGKVRDRLGPRMSDAEAEALRRFGIEGEVPEVVREGIADA